MTKMRVEAFNGLMELLTDYQKRNFFIWIDAKPYSFNVCELEIRHNTELGKRMLDEIIGEKSV